MEEKSELTTVNKGLNARTAGITFSIATVAIILSSLVFALINLIFKIQSYSTAFWYLNFLASPVAIFAAVAVSMRIRKLSIKSVFPVKCKPKYYLIGFLVVFGLFFSLNQINDLFTKLIGKEEGEVYVQMEIFFSSMSGGNVFGMIIVAALLPAVFEEALFRGVILFSAENELGSIRTVFLSGFCFMLFHTSPEQTVYQFISGCLFALVAVRSGSVLPGTVMHFLNNAAVVIITVCSAKFGGNSGIYGGLSIALTVLGALSLVGGTLWLALDKGRIVKTFEKSALKGFFITAALGIVVCAVLWIASLFGL